MSSVVQRARIPTELRVLIEGGSAAWAATSDAQRIPEAARVMGARVSAEGERLTLYLPTVQLGRTLENLRVWPRIAVIFGNVTDFRAVLQIKGEAIAVRDARADEQEIALRWKSDFIDALAQLRSREMVSRLSCWPSVAVELSVRELFSQAPGPGAGAPWR